jgi:hypothetical protein
MIETKYDAETDMLEVTINGQTEAVSFKEFMDKIPTERARVEYLLSKIKDVREKKISQIDNFMKTIMDLTTKVAEVRTKMEKEAKEENHLAVKSLRYVVQSVLDEKNTYREVRAAIKMLSDEEAELKSQLLELTT